MSVSPPLCTNWVVRERLTIAEKKLQDELGISSLLAAALIARGLEDPNDAYTFLNPSLDQLHDPKLLPDYELAVDTILGARERGEVIFVHGDYDADGVTSAALLTRFLQKIGCKVVPHVPHRMKDGYGVHPNGVKAALDAEAKLFMTCDCGISAHEQIDAATQAGMAVLVTDHHEIDGELPNAAAVINPHRTDSLYPFSMLSGVGVAFKLAQGITEELGHPKEAFCRAYLDLAALGTIADVMPLLGENRVLAKFGLERLAESNKEGLRALLAFSDLASVAPGDLKAWHVSFRIAPRLNAVGRLDDAAIALDMLLEKDSARAHELAAKLEELNNQRRHEQERIIEEAVELVLSNGMHESNAIVVANEDWHPGVIGIVAGKLTERFCRPAFVITIDRNTNVAKGSARTISGFHLAEAIYQCKDILISGGGHQMAAGFSLDPARLDEFFGQIERLAGEQLSDDDFQPKIPIDAEVEAVEATLVAAEQLALLEPFGQDNPEPVFCTKSLTLASLKSTSNANTAFASFTSSDDCLLEAVSFSQGAELLKLPIGNKGQIAYCIQVDTWNGKSRLRLKLKDFQLS